MALVLAYCTGKLGYFDLFTASCERHGIEPVLLGWGEKWIGSGQKLLAIRDFLTEIDKDEIVISVDPYDIVFLAGLEEIVEKFKNCNSEFVCSALRLDGFLKTVYNIEFNRTGLRTPSNRNGYNYLNAGAWISYAGYVVKLVNDLEAKYNLDSGDIDQLFLTSAYIKMRRGLKLDCECQLFQNIIFRNFLSRKPDLRDISFCNQRIRNQRTGSYPSILHISANTLIGDIGTKLGYSRQQSISEKGNLTYFKKAVYYFSTLVKHSVSNKYKP